jgi:hypothetical protein
VPSYGRNFGRTYASVMAILEDLPRKPELGDNKLAAVSDNSWLRTNVYGCSVQVTGTVDQFQVISAADTRVEVRLMNRGVTWRQYDFTSRIFTYCDGAANDLSKLQPGDSVTMKGIVGEMVIEWGSEGRRPTPAAKGQIRLQLDNCSLIAGDKEPAGESKQATDKKPVTESKPAAVNRLPAVTAAESKPAPNVASPNAKAAGAIAEKPEGLMEVVSTSASDMELRRLKVPGGWFVFTKWHMREPRGTPDHSDAMCLFYPDPRHTWDMPRSPAKGTVTKKTTGEPQAGSQFTPTPPMRPLGANLMVDKNGIIWDRGKPVGSWGVESGGRPARSR